MDDVWLVWYTLVTVFGILYDVAFAFGVVFGVYYLGRIARALEKK